MSTALAQFFQEMNTSSSTTSTTEEAETTTTVTFEIVPDTAGALSSYKFCQSDCLQRRRKNKLRRWDSIGSDCSYASSSSSVSTSNGTASSSTKQSGAPLDLSPQPPRRKTFTMPKLKASFDWTSPPKAPKRQASVGDNSSAEFQLQPSSRSCDTSSLFL